MIQQQAKQFIEMLVSQQLLAPEIVEELRRQVSESKTRLSPELLAKLLVDNGHLTKFQATKLIAEVREKAPLNDLAAPVSEEEELGFAPEVQAKPARGAQTSQKRSNNPPVAAVFVDDDAVDEAEVVDVEPVEVVPVVGDVEVVASPVKATAFDGDFDDVPRPVTKVVKPSAAKDNPFDSFRILGIGLILAVVSVAGFFLVRHFIRGNADERLKAADASYEQRSYETAAKMYQDFAKTFTADERVSYAKVRAALALLRKDVEMTPDPIVGLRTALDVLPNISGESSLSQQQSDLAGALIGLASKFNERADRTEATADRKQLMNEMDRLLELIDNPQFVGTAQKDQQAPTLQRILEDRKRIQLEIDRDEKLIRSLASMDEHLEAQNVLAAYQVRKELTDRYPVLRNHPELLKRIQRATALQQTQVKPNSRTIELRDEGIHAEVGSRIVLANRSGKPAPDLAGKVIFVRAKGSVYGIEGESGSVLWRRFVGRDFQSDPIRLDNTDTSDVIVCDSEQGMVSRLDAMTGDTLWSAGFGSPVHSPSVEGEDLLVASFDGTLTNLDSQGGQTKWSIQLPQPLPVRPGIAFGKPNLYLPGEHSNLYVIARSDGNCRQVYYLNNRAGAIAVPPMLLLGQLFVFENRSTESSSVRVFETDDSGLILSESTTYFQLSGNIVIPPQVDGRKLIVQSDMGECLVLDVEPSAETRKVTELARKPRSSFRPQVSWSIAENNKLWVGDARLTRFDLQVALQEVKLIWSTNDGDTYTGPLQKFGNTLVNTRNVRGNRGVRVAAVEADSLRPLWETDVAVPVMLVSPTPEGAFDIVNSAAALFSFDGQRLVNEATENPGGGRAATLFQNPLQMDAASAVLFNASQPNEIAHYSRTGKRLRRLSAGFSGGEPSGDAVAMGPHFGIGLDNGQFVVIDPATGQQAARAYQVELQPGRKVQWNAPVYIADARTLIVASSGLKLVRLSVGDELRALTEVELESPLVGPLIQLGQQVAAVERNAAGDRLVLFDATSLARGAAQSLSATLVAGPFPVEDSCVLQTSTQLTSFDSNGALEWAIDFPSSQLIAAPLSSDGRLVLATRDGQLWIIDGQTGESLGTTRTRQAFTSGPVPQGQGFLLGSDEGTVIALPTPVSTEGDR